MLDSYQFHTLWTQYHHQSPKDPFSLSEAIKIITSYTLEESRDIVDRTDGSRGKALHPALLDLLDSAIPALQELIHTASRRRWASKVYVVDPCEMNMDALRHGYTFANMNAIWADFVRRILKAEEWFKQLCFPQTALTTTPDALTSHIQHSFRSSLKTTSSTRHVTSHALPPSSTNCRVQPAATPVAFIKTTETKDNLMDEGKTVQGKAEKMVENVLGVLGSVAKGDAVRSTFSTEHPSLTETAPPIQTRPSASLNRTLKSLPPGLSAPETAPAATAGSLGSPGSSIRPHSPSTPSSLAAAREDAVPGLLASSMHPELSPAPAEAEDTSTRSDIRLVPGKDPPIQPSPSAPLDTAPGPAGAVKSSPAFHLLLGFTSTPIIRSFVDFNVYSEGEFDVVPQLATPTRDGVEIGLRGMVCAPSSTTALSTHDTSSVSALPRLATRLDSARNMPNAVKTSLELPLMLGQTDFTATPPFLSSSGLPTPPIVRLFVFSSTASQPDSTQTAPLTVAPCDAVASQDHRAVPGALTSPIHGGLSTAPTHAEDTIRSNNISLGAGTTPPTQLRLAPCLDSRQDMPNTVTVKLSPPSTTCLIQDVMPSAAHHTIDERDFRLTDGYWKVENGTAENTINSRRSGSCVEDQEHGDALSDNLLPALTVSPHAFTFPTTTRTFAVSNPRS